MGKPIILVCEDEETTLKAIKNILTKRKYEVYAAGNGEEAIKKAKEINPDLILMDIRMPKVNGIEAIQEIKKSGIKAQVIILTAFQSVELSKEATKYGVFDYIVKPISGEKLIETVEKALRELPPASPK